MTIFDHFFLKSQNGKEKEREVKEVRVTERKGGREEE